jgi:hypothetical protein
MRNVRWIILPVALFALVGCAGSLGKLPPVMVEMYDQGKPDGWMEIEADRKGRIFSIETDIPVEALPADIKAAAEAELPGARITGAEWERIGKADCYEVKLAKGGREYELVYKVDGTLIEKEVSLRRGEEPSGVMQAAMNVVPGSRFKSVERIERAEGEDVYHVKLIANNASYKVELDGSGNVLRAVREARAEIEIPLKP